METLNPRWLIKTWAALSSSLSIALAISFFLSQPERLSAQAYWAVVKTGGSTTWGIIFLLVGCLVGAACYNYKLTAMRMAAAVGALCYFALAITFALAAIKFSTANLTAPVVYGWIGACHALLGYVINEQIEADEEDDDD